MRFTGRAIAAGAGICALAGWMLDASATLQRASDPPRLFEPMRFRADEVGQRLAPRLAPGSHLKIFLPVLPYIYLGPAINGTLLRPANNREGWSYELATSFTQVNETTYDFVLRQGVQFQDGTAFNADMVVLNMEYFRKKPLLFTKIDTVFDHAETLGPYRVRFHLKEKYGQFISDLIWVQFYTKTYLEKFGWNGKATCPNLAEPGPYGLGPYILKEGYAEGDRQTPKVVLEANPLYWDKRHPFIDKVTVYTELGNAQALNQVTQQEGALDIAPIPFSAKVETMLSAYGKIVVAPSTNNWAIHMNLINGNKRLLRREVRIALNQAIHQANLLNFTYDGEGLVKPTLESPLYEGMARATRNLKPYSEVRDAPEQTAKLKAVLDGLSLNVITQERFEFLWKGIEFQLATVGVKLNFEVTNSEKVVFDQLLSTNARKNTKAWDLLIWGDDDWHNSLWSAFLVYRTHNYWSTIFRDPVLDGFIEDFFRATRGTEAYSKSVDNVVRHVYENGYMLVVPAPHQVFAINKEVDYHPWKMAQTPLWEVRITTQHWSVRKGPYPDDLKRPVELVRYRQDEYGRIIRSRGGTE